MDTQLPAAADRPASPMRLALEEPSLPDLARIWRGLKRQRFLALAALLSLLIHAALLTIGVTLRQGGSAPSVALNVQLGADSPNARLVPGSSALLTKPATRNEAAVPPARVTPRSKRKARVGVPKPATEVSELHMTSAPAALFEWWRYADPNLGYFGPRELDQLAAPAKPDEFLLPLNDQAPPEPGRVVVRLYIGKDGQVDRIEIQESEPPGLFEEAILRELYRTRFTPAIKDGLAVKSRKDLEIFFGPVAYPLGHAASQTDAQPSPPVHELAPERLPQ